jgi:uncharacterized repeat protein (TIGR01451 family)
MKGDFQVKRTTKVRTLIGLLAGGLLALAGCRDHMPHAFTWPGGGDVTQSHAKPPEGGYYTNWDPFAVSLEVEPLEDVNPVRTQHVLVATVRDKDGKPLPNRRVEWIVHEGPDSVGEIVEVDESGWRNGRGYIMDNHRAVSHTNNCDHVLDRGNDDPSDDVNLTKGQTWCVITSPMEGDTFITVYCPGIYDWSKHKVFVVKHWYDVRWTFPPPATNPVGTTHDVVTLVVKASDGTYIPNHAVTYKILDGPAATLEPGGGQTARVMTDAQGTAKVTIKQAKPAEGTNNISIDLVRPENPQCCEPEVHIASGRTSKTWIGPRLKCDKKATSDTMVGGTIEYVISATNPSQVDAKAITVTDTLPDGVQYVSSDPAAQVSGQTLTWSLGNIAPNATRTVTIQAKATRTGKFENCAEVKGEYNLADRCCATTVVTAPKLAIEKKCPAEVIICDPITYTIIVKNNGDGPARNVKVTDNLPSGIATADGKTTVTETWPELKPGESKEIRISAKASKTGKYDNKVNVTADGGASAETTCSTTVRQPVLAVTKTGPATQFVGRDAKYEITVSNTGDAAARDTVLVDPLPTGATFVSASDNGRFADGKVTWNLGTIEAGGSKKVSLTLKATQRTTAKNTATATAYCAEASASTTSEFKGVPAILLEMIDVADPIEVGASETYVIEVTNQGTAEDTNITIVATIPAEMEYVSSDGPTKAVVEGRTVRFPAVPSLAPKGKLTYKVVTKGTKEADVRVKVALDSDMIDAPVEETESTHIY